MAKLFHIVLTATVVVLLHGSAAQADVNNKIHSHLLQKFREFPNSAVDILVSLAGRSTADVLASLDISNTAAAPRSQRLVAISSALREHAQNSQKPVLNWFARSRHSPAIASVKKIQSIWITNQIYVRGANPALIEELAQFPEVSLIKEDELFLLETTPADYAKGVRPEDRRDGRLSEWGIENIRAPAVWNSPGGNQGEGVIVGSIDTGVRRTHETLVDNFLGPYGWLDPYESSAEPNDIIGQGTHAMGTMVGSKGIGVAPGARWAACKACEFSCPFSMLLACGEFFLCPNPNCSLAPHLIINGWRAARGDNSYDDVIRAWRLGGIIPIFTNGNVGPECGTAASPGDSREGVITVSLSTSSDTLSDRSSKGPTVTGAIKPDVIAPGELINSASHLSDTDYTLLSGVSQPHVGGAVALLLSHNQNLTFDHVYKLLADGAATWIQQTGYACGGISDDTFPNHSVGHGKVDAFRSFMLAVASKHTQSS